MKPAISGPQQKVRPRIKKIFCTHRKYPNLHYG